VYRRRDVELAVLVKRLLHEDGLTIPGAKKRLRELERDRVSSPPDPQAKEHVGVRADLLAMRRELADALKELDALLRIEPAPKQNALKATVTASVPSSVPIRTRS
jgi:hypothetical protein